MASLFAIRPANLYSAADLIPSGYRPKGYSSSRTVPDNSTSSGSRTEYFVEYSPEPMFPYVAVSKVTGQGIPDLSKFRAPPASYPYPTDPTIPLDSLLRPITDKSAKRGGLTGGGNGQWDWLAWRKLVIWGTGTEPNLTFVTKQVYATLSPAEVEYFKADERHKDKQFGIVDAVGVGIGLAVAGIATAGVATAVAAGGAAAGGAAGSGAIAGGTVTTGAAGATAAGTTAAGVGATAAGAGGIGAGTVATGGGVLAAVGAAAKPVLTSLGNMGLAALGKKAPPQTVESQPIDPVSQQGLLLGGALILAALLIFTSND